MFVKFLSKKQLKLCDKWIILHKYGINFFDPSIVTVKIRSIQTQSLWSVRNRLSTVRVDRQWRYYRQKSPMGFMKILEESTGSNEKLRRSVIRIVSEKYTGINA